MIPVGKYVCKYGEIPCVDTGRFSCVDTGITNDGNCIRNFHGIAENQSTFININPLVNASFNSFLSDDKT